MKYRLRLLCAGLLFCSMQSAAAQETDNINASIAPLMRNTLYSGAETFKKNGEFARLTVKFGAGFPLFY